VLAIDASATLEDLHFAIQEAVGFDNDHLYEFYVARTDRSRERDRFDEENEGIFKMTLEDLFPLPKQKHLYYMFDYGDSWLFKISKTRKKAWEPEPDLTYPRLILETGKKPVQYPAWDEDDE
jgi:hypothetical protein